MSAPELPWSIRAGLRLLPRPYREDHVAEIRATLIETADAGRMSAAGESLSLVALSVRLRGQSLLAPPSDARARAAAIAAVVLPILLIVPAARAIDLGLPIQPSPSGLFWIWSALVPAWIAAAVAAVLTLFGAGRWAHRFSILAVVLFIGGLLALASTTNAPTAVHESGWLPLLATGAALNRDLQRLRVGRGLLRATGLAVVAVITAGAAVTYVAAGPVWRSLLPTALGPFLYPGRLVLGGGLILVCLIGLASRTVRAAVPVVAALGMAYVGANLSWRIANEPLQPIGTTTREYSLLEPLLLQLIVAPLAVFLAARAVTALIDHARRTPAVYPLAH